VYLSRSGKHLYGLAEPISLLAWHFSEIPPYGKRLGWRARSRLRAWSTLGRVAAVASSAGRHGDRRQLAGRFAALADDAAVAMRPETLFASRPLRGTLDKALVSIPHEREDVRVESVEPAFLAERLVFALRADPLRLHQRYLAYRFAFPANSSSLIEEADELERTVLLDALAGSEAFALYHPYPAPVRALYDAMTPLVA
jgi:hypothetical protein